MITWKLQSTVRYWEKSLVRTPPDTYSISTNIKNNRINSNTNGELNAQLEWNAISEGGWLQEQILSSLWITQTTAQNRKFIFGGLQEARASEITAKRSIQQQQRRKQLNAPWNGFVFQISETALSVKWLFSGKFFKPGWEWRRRLKKHHLPAFFVFNHQLPTAVQGWFLVYVRE